MNHTGTALPYIIGMVAFWVFMPIGAWVALRFVWRMFR